MNMQLLALQGRLDTIIPKFIDKSANEKWWVVSTDEHGLGLRGLRHPRMMEALTGCLNDLVTPLQFKWFGNLQSWLSI